MFQLQITHKQCKHTKGVVDVIMSKFNNHKNIIKCAQNIGCIFDTGFNVWAVIMY